MTDPYTPTRQMAQSAAQKAADAYAAARQAVSRVEGLEARCEALEAQNAELTGRVDRLERLTAQKPVEVTPIRPRRKAA